jgi:hypothetical protein
MTLRRRGSLIVLEGDCPVEDAEALARLLGDPSVEGIDWTGAQRVHTAVVQLVLRGRGAVTGPCGDPFVARWIEPHMVAALMGKR